MGFFSKRSDPPKITRTPTLPELPSKSPSEPISELPAIPANSSTDNLNENIIKSAMDDTVSDEPDMKEEHHKTPEVMEVMSNNERYSKRGGRIPMPPSYSDESPVGGKPTRETIFVKIDKFNTAQDTLIEIEEKIRVLASDIQSLKEVKMNEVRELNTWDEELKKVNDRLSKIDHSIFGDV